MTYQQRNIVLGVISAVCLVAALIVFLSNRGQNRVMADEYITLCVCLACQQECDIRHGPLELVPFTCPNPDCGEAAVYPWYFCNDCKRRFVPQPLMREPGGPLRPPATITCTACGSVSITPYAPEWLKEEPIGDAPLPRWSP